MRAYRNGAAGLAGGLLLRRAAPPVLGAAVRADLVARPPVTAPPRGGAPLADAARVAMLD